MKRKIGLNVTMHQTYDIAHSQKSKQQNFLRGEARPQGLEMWTHNRWGAERA